MANDIDLAIDTNPIKNGTMVLKSGFTQNNVIKTYDRYVKNTPIITDIQSKYDNRFDNPSYYYGGANPDGGDV